MNLNLLSHKIKTIRGVVFISFLAVVLSGIAISSSSGHQEKTQDIQQWTVETHDRTNFPLIGKHRTVECRECHLNLVFEGTPRACEACHWERRQDDRYKLRLGAHCEDCHTPHSWKNVLPNKWNHTAETGFNLEGIHRTLDCIDCHGEQDFQLTSIDCFSCHEEDYAQTREPAHAAAGFPLQCQICHRNSNRWEGANFSHDFFTLRGQHVLANCSGCHLDGQFSGLSTDCFFCHSEDFRETEDPDHERLGFPTDCVICHGTNSETWDNAYLNHDVFILSGQHKIAACIDCHSDGIFAGRPSECVSCHLADFQNTSDPDHQAAAYPTACSACHGTRAETWKGAKLLHDSFPLTGQHLLADCIDCHAEGVYAGRPSVCVSCHLADFQNTSDPDHQVAAYPTDCVACHSASAETWEGAKLLHDSFPLSGQHLLADCIDCHAGGVYAGRPSECVSCHLADFQNTSDPDHDAAAYPTDCAACHGTSAETWEGAKLVHDSFPLSGQHLLADCIDCHADGIYAGRPSECVSCHLADFQNTSDPDHEAAAYPTDCAACHGTSAETWGGAELNHDSFPLTGQHLLADCIDCHAEGIYAGRPSDCISCHFTDFQNTTDPDHELLNFPTDCETCHGSSAETWEDATFDHSSIWPIQGAHTTLDCSQCHIAGSEVSPECYGCHASDYEHTSDPDHEAVGFPTTCEFCHYPTHITWTQAQFDHSFPIESGNHSIFSCSDCHLTSNYLEFSCIHCHAHNSIKMSNRHKGIAGYSYLSQACYACHPNGEGQ